MIGSAEALGAVSIVNALAGGKGATIAVEFRTRARVELSKRRGTWATTFNGEDFDSPLAREAAKLALKTEGEAVEDYSGIIETRTSLPTGVGLKTSSAAAVATTLATSSALGKGRIETSKVLDCSADSSLSSGTSITGAYDDAASCLLGGINFADNTNRELLSSKRLGRTLRVVIRIPPSGSRRNLVPIDEVRSYRNLADRIFAEGRDGRHWKAMTLNGLLYSTIYGYDPSPAIRAIETGALGAGLSGTGPAVAAIFEEKRSTKGLEAEWSADGGTVLRGLTSDGVAKIR